MALSSLTNYSIILAMVTKQLLALCHCVYLMNLPFLIQLSKSENKQKFYGPERDRTADPLLAKQVLSQLSYRPVIELVGPSGFEPLTPALSALCSTN
jgi:hypothetical protein